ncbi:class E sortase [Streptomyces sp. NPDC052236]|uniref:class E sortase n=1 Tax=Streptomyces sp. NPDC052236 TaxID=3365686 RepID=UPI0037D6927C
MRERKQGQERIPVVVHGRRSRTRVALGRGLWGAAEVAVTLGVVVLLLVVHQLWWTNQQARQDAQRQVHALEREWGDLPKPQEPAYAEGGRGADGPGEARAQDTGNRRPSASRRDRAYALLRIPRLNVVAPVAHGIAKKGVLDSGYVGHYPQTAQPGQAGNFAVAGHRNTHGEPFRHINRLRGGDTIQVETREAIYVYVVGSRLAQTSPRDTGVIAPVPRSLVKPGAGYSEPGYYLTLTTCTPEYSSRYRLIIWGELKSMSPR